MGATGTGTPDASFATWGDGRSHSRCSVAISGNPLICREMLTSGSLVPCFDKLSVSLRLKFNKRETQKQTLFKMFFCGFGPPSLVFLSARNTLKLGHTKFLYPARCTIRLLFCTLSVSLLFPSVCNLEGRRCLGFLFVSPSATCCNAEETYSFAWDNEDNENRSFTMRSNRLL